MNLPVDVPMNAAIGSCSLLCAGLRVLTVPAMQGESPAALLKRVQAQAKTENLQIFHGVLFGDPALRRSVQGIEWPLSFLGRHDTPKGVFFGGRFEALPVGHFQWVKGENGCIQGALWEDDANRFLWAGKILPSDVNASPATQAGDVWAQMETLLRANGFLPNQIVRTWFYNDHILDWYDDFNAVRTAFFKKYDIFGHFVPASTGIGASNDRGAALCAAVVAMAPKAKKSAVRLTMAPSPLQCPAYNYKSAFSRAAACDFTDGRLLFVSGTASIEPGGRTANVGNLDKQIDLTLCVVNAILRASHLEWSDAVRAIAYFPKIEWMEAFERRRIAEKIPAFPFVYAHADICRGDLMFELELDAVRTAVNK